MAGILDFLFGNKEDPNAKEKGILGSATGDDLAMFYDQGPGPQQGVLNQAAPQQPQAQVAPQGAPQVASQAPVDPNSLGQQFKNATWDTHLLALARALGAAGSRDPMKTAMEFTQQDLEAQKQRTDAHRSRFIQANNGAGIWVTDPQSGNVKFVTDPKLLQNILDIEKIKGDASMLRLVTGKNLEFQNNTAKTERDKSIEEAGGLNTPATFDPTVTQKINSIDSLISRLPRLDKVGSPVIANTIDQTFGRVTGSPEYETRRELDRYLKEGVMQDIKVLGTNPSEGDRRFMERKVPTQDDPLSYKMQYLLDLKDLLNKKENQRVQAAQRRDSAISGGGSTSNVPPPNTGGASSGSSTPSSDSSSNSPYKASKQYF